MKKVFLSIAACLLVGANFVFIGCGKDNDSPTANAVHSAKSSPKNATIVGFSESEDGEINLLIDKEGFLKTFENSLNKNGGEYVVEDLKLWNEEYKAGEYTPLMSVSFYDLKEECGNTLFILLDTIHDNGGICYAVNGDSPHSRCSGGCKKPCRAIFDNNRKFLMCQPCPDPMPNFSFSEWQEKKAWLAIHKCVYVGGVGGSPEPSFRMAISIIGK
jgi:hypothetical protein